MKHRLIFFAFTIFAVITQAAAQAEPVSPKVKSAAFLEVVAAKGAECDLLRPWQATALRALNYRDMENWSAELREELAGETSRRLSETDCDNESMTAWIDGASKGFDSEMLPPYLVAYRAMARMENPPKAFSYITLRTDYAPAIAAIDAKLAALEASGAVAEGGKPWPDYIARTERFVEGFAQTLNSADAAGEKADQAAAWLAQAALVVEQWLADEAPAGE